MAATTDDRELLDRFARERDESAFAELVRRHVGLVYSAAVRRVGDRALADDVAQAAFVVLARRPEAARRGAAPVSAWLLNAVRYAAANARRMERRRRRHEAVAAGMRAEDVAGGNPADVLVWREIAARLDDAVLRLPSADRTAVLLRYFERRPVAEVAAALGVSEAAAKQRLGRAVDKLRRRLDGRGGPSLILAGSSGLAALLTTNAVQAAPPTLAAAATSAYGAGGTAAAAALAKGAIGMMTYAKLKVGIATLAAAAVVGTGAAVLVARGDTRAGGPPPAVAPAGAGDLAAKAAARVKAAEAVVAQLEKAEQAGAALTPDFVKSKAAAHRRVAEARIDAAAPADRAGRVKAAEEYVGQCRQMLAHVRARRDAGFDASDTAVAEAEYTVADAEYALEKVRVGG
ncbi:MAG TPA: sigma-70 family RNA polymerase sigma factor [Humisphaera sp.]